MSWGGFEQAPVAPAKIDIPAHIQEALVNNQLPLDQDGLLMLHKKYKEWLDFYKEAEMELRKLTVSVLVPNPTPANEGVNTVPLGNGYDAKVTLKFNYKLSDDNEQIENVLDEIAAIGNEGTFIAERIVTWKADFHVTEYRSLMEQAEKNNPMAIAILAKVNTILTITDAAPTLAIKEPKSKK